MIKKEGKKCKKTNKKHPKRVLLGIQF